MYDWHRFQKEQRHFLVLVRSSGFDFGPAIKKLDLTTARVMRWIRSPRFYKALKQAVRENTRFAGLALEQMWGAEMRAMSEDVQAGKVIDPQRKERFDYIQLMRERNETLRKLMRRPLRKKGRKKAEPARDLIHPNARDRAPEIARLMMRKIREGHERQVAMKEAAMAKSQ